MHIDFTKHPLLQEALFIVKTLEEAGHAAYFVGGAVRDVLLGRSIHDVDIATSALPEQTMLLFPKTFATGLQHGTVTVVHKHVNYEVTTFRIESSYLDNRRPENVSFVKELQLDLSRRDFTMNAMAINVNGEVVDYFAGQEALKNKLLKTVGEAAHRFAEDALRMLRAIRFATAYDLTCDKRLWESIRQKKELLTYISMERVEQEVNKMLEACTTIAQWRLLYDSELMMYTKKPLHLQQVLSFHFTHEHRFKDAKISNVEWLWAVTYFSAGYNEQQLKADLAALVFPKKTSIYIQQCLNVLYFCDAASKAISNSEANTTSYIHHYRDLIGSYHMTLKMIIDQKMDGLHINEVDWIIRLYWLEHLQASPHMSIKNIKPLLVTCGFAELVDVLSHIEAQQLIKKVTELKLTGKQLAEQLSMETGAWLKLVLQMLFIAVNLHIVENEPTSLVKFAQIILDKGGI